MHQVVENFAVKLRFRAILLQKQFQRRQIVRGYITHPQGKLAKLLAIIRQHVGLQIKHDLQHVLDSSEEGIVLFEDRLFQMGQTADFPQFHECFERIARTQLGQIAAVKQLEELNHKFHVADTAAARFSRRGRRRRHRASAARSVVSVP